MEKVDSYSPRQALSIGLFLSIINFKNAAMVASGAVVIGAEGLSYWNDHLILLFIFCFVAPGGIDSGSNLPAFQRRCGNNFR